MKNQKRTKYNINSTVVIIGVLAIVLFVNILATLFVNRFPVKIDLTSSKLYQLTDVTKNYLKQIDRPVDIYILSSETDQDKDTREVLDNYAKANSNITVQNIDPEKNPTFGKKYVQDSKTSLKNYVILDNGTRYKAYAPGDLYQIDQNNQNVNMKVEQKITSGLKYLESESASTVYFTSGRGEIELTGAKQRLEEENYKVKDLNLVSEDIPSDASILIIASPDTDYTMAEINKLDAFLEHGGKLQVWMSGDNAKELTNLYEYLKRWGISINDDSIIETSNNQVYSDGQNLFISPVMEQSEITDPITEKKRLIAYLPYSKSLDILFDTRDGIEVETLWSTSSEAFGAVGFEDRQNADKQPDDKAGPLTVSAVAMKKGQTQEQTAGVFVSGTTALLDYNTQLVEGYSFANLDYFMNVTNYMQGSIDDMTIPIKTMNADKIMMSNISVFAFGFVLAVLIPLIVLIAGIVVWARRRHL
jgi:ABC-2 type transport system permease protein